jgi:hypothetical protein
MYTATGVTERSYVDHHFSMHTQCVTVAQGLPYLLSSGERQCDEDLYVAVYGNNVDGTNGVMSIPLHWRRNMATVPGASPLSYSFLQPKYNVP